MTALAMISCGKGEKTEQQEPNAPVDFTDLVRAFDQNQSENEYQRDSIVLADLEKDMPETDVYLLADTAFTLRVPEYRQSGQPFLAVAEDFYNSCLLSWNVWSNFEVWLRGHTSEELFDDKDVVQSINSINADIINDQELRSAAQQYKDAIVRQMSKTPDQWDEDFDPMEPLISFNDMIESKAYKYFDDQETFTHSVDSVMNMAESLALDKLQLYLDADEDHQLRVMLDGLASCKSFDEQCSLWRNWANCPKSPVEDEWIVAIGCKLMDSGQYNPDLHRIWITWRALCQGLKFGSSRDSSIPNDYYNEYRKKCYVTCLRYIEQHPDDVYAMNCAAALGGRTNLNRFGQNYFGNEAMIEEALLLPKRFKNLDKESE